MAPKGKNLGGGCLILFALPFAAIGVFALGKAAQLLSVRDWKQAVASLMFGLVFGGVGFGLIAVGIFGAKKSKKAARAEAAHPNEPWLWREDWARGEVKSMGKTSLMAVSLFAFFWNAITWTLFFSFLTAHRSDKNMFYFVALFPLIGLFLLLWALREFRRWRRFGESIFKMTTVPGVIGGPLAGVIHCSRPLPRATEVRLRLACFERDTGGESTSENLQWEDEKIFSGDVLQAGAGIPVMFNIPFECHPTAVLSDTRSSFWRLETRAEIPGTKYLAQFEVPVFKTAQSSPEARPLPDPAAAYEKPVEASPPSGIIIRPAATGGTEFIFTAARNRGSAVGLTLFTTVWIGMAVAMIKFKAPIGFPIVWGIVSVLLLLLIVTQWTAWSRVIADVSGLQLAKSWLFVPSQRRLATAEVQKVETKFRMSAGTSSYYDLQAVTTDGKRVKLASNIKGKREAEWLAHEIQNALAKK